MKLTIFTDAWVPQINGVVSTLQATKKEMERKGWEIRIIHPDLFKVKIPLQPSTGIYMPLLPMGIADEEVQNAEHIHIATEGAIGLAARYSCKKYNKRYTTSFHTRYPEYVHIHAGIPPRITSKYFRWFHRNSHTVMATTPAMVDYCHELGIDNVKIWSRGVDTSLFRPIYPKPKTDNISAIYVGRISAEKNLEAFLSVTDPHITKTLIGDGPQLEEYKSKYTDAKFLGKMDAKKIAQELPKHDVFAWPSLTDTFGLVVLEGMACGLPIAAFDNEVNRYIIENGVSGILTCDMTTAILKAHKLNSEDSVARAKKFSWESATDQFISHLI